MRAVALVEPTPMPPTSNEPLTKPTGHPASQRPAATVDVAL